MDAMNPFENPTPTEQPTAAEALEKLEKVAGDGFDRSQMDELKKKLAALGKSEKKTSSGSEAPAEPEKADEPEQRLLSGSEVEWSEYNLDFNIAHLYPKSHQRFVPAEGAIKWVAMVIEFHSTTKEFLQYQKDVNAPGSTDGARKEPLNLGRYLNDKVNGRDQWRIAAVMPGPNGQCGLLLEREVPFVLPDPVQLVKKEEAPVPTDAALAQVEDAAAKFVVDNAGDLREDTPAPIGLTPIERGTVEHEAAVASLDENGAVEARVGVGVASALATAAAETEPAPQAGVIQPDAVENPLLGNRPVPAAGYSAAQELLRALNDPNFRASLPRE